MERVRLQRVADRSAQTDDSGPRQCHRGRGNRGGDEDAAGVDVDVAAVAAADGGGGGVGGEDEGDADQGLAQGHCSEVRGSSHPSYRFHCWKHWGLNQNRGGNRADTNSPKRSQVEAGTCCLPCTG